MNNKAPDHFRKIDKKCCDECEYPRIIIKEKSYKCLKHDFLIPINDIPSLRDVLKDYVCDDFKEYAD